MLLRAYNFTVAQHSALMIRVSVLLLMCCQLLRQQQTFTPGTVGHGAQVHEH